MIRYIALSILITNCINIQGMEWDIAAEISGGNFGAPQANYMLDQADNNESQISKDEIVLNDEHTSFAVRKSETEWIWTERSMKMTLRVLKK